MRVLIAGCGYLGSELARRLVAEGHRVWGLKRDPTGLPDGVEPLARDLVGHQSHPAFPAIDALVYCAAPDGSGEARYRDVYVDGLGNLLRGFGALPPRRLIFTSSTAVYGQEDGSVVDEGSATEPVDYRGRVLLEAETVLASTRSEAVSLRLARIYGPGRTRLLDDVRRGEARFVPGRFLNLIHRDDAARILLHLIELHPGVAERAYVGSDREPVEQRVLLEWLAERGGCPAPRPTGAPAGGRSNKRCSSARLLASGYRFLYSTFREGFGKIMKEENRE